MGKQISSMYVSLTGQGTGLAKTFSGARGQVKGLQTDLGSLNSAFGSTQKLIGLGLSAFGVYGITSFVKGQFESIDANAKLARRLEITTESLTGLQHASDLAGVSNEELTAGLEKMLKTIGGVKEEGDGAGDALSKIGLSAKDLKNRSADESLGMIADKLAGIPTVAERAAATTAIFGKAGQRLLPLLSEGSRGIAKAVAEAKRLGITFSELDGHKVEEANDAMTRMKAVATGVGRSLTIALAPSVERAALATQNWALHEIAAIKAGYAWIQQNWDLAISLGSVAAGAGLVAVTAPKLIGILRAAPSILAAVGSAARFALAAPIIGIGVAAFGLLAAVAIRSYVANETWTQSAYRVARAIGAIKGATEDLGDAYEDAGKAAAAVRDAQIAVAEAKSPQEQIDANQVLVDALHRRAEAIKRVADTQNLPVKHSAYDPAVLDLTSRKDAAESQGRLDDAKKIQDQIDAMLAGKDRTPDLGFTKGMVDDVKQQARQVESELDRLRSQQIGLKATIDPENLSLYITPQLKPLKAIRVGSAEAQMARYLQPSKLATPKPAPTSLATNAPAPLKSSAPSKPQPFEGFANFLPPEAQGAGQTPAGKPSPQPHRKYNNDARVQLDDTLSTPEGLFAVHSSQAGIRATLPADLMDNVRKSLTDPLSRPLGNVPQPYNATHAELTDARKIEDNQHGNDKYFVHSQAGVAAKLDPDQYENLKNARTGRGNSPEVEAFLKRRAADQTPTSYEELMKGQQSQTPQPVAPVQPPPVDPSAFEDMKEPAKKQLGELTKQTGLLTQIVKQRDTSPTIMQARF